MNFVLFGFGACLIGIGLFVLSGLRPERYLQSTAALLSFFLVGVGVLLCIVAGWLIERDRERKRAVTPA